MSLKVIGRGTWLDKVAHELIEREKRLRGTPKRIRVESGLGASGFPHLGSFADAARAYGVKLAVEDAGYPSEYIAFSDDMDGLRKVPAGLPKRLKEHLGRPVSEIPDPFKCHESFGAHMSSQLLDALDRCGVQYRFISATQAYKEGLLNQEIKTILNHADQVGEIIRRELSQEKYLEALPYFPICEKCGRIYTTKAHKWIPEEERILYRCEGGALKGAELKGCGYKGEVDYRQGRGKLSWKAEFAARWSALNISFEAYGKDIADSVRVNDTVMKEVLGKPPPYHVRYEMFLDKTGRKISKSTGNVFTPQTWLRYGSPSSLLLLMFKRIVGTRELSIEDIPKYMDEHDWLEQVYFGMKKVSDEKELAKLKGLYEYCHLLKPPAEPSTHIPYNTLVQLASVAPKGLEKSFIAEKLKKYGYRVAEDVAERIQYAVNWSRDFPSEEAPKERVQLTEPERQALLELAGKLKHCRRGEEAQTAVFEAARSKNIPVKRFFNILYLILLGKDSGPKLGPFIATLGASEVAEKLEKAAAHTKILEAG
ncbi:MAG: lysine--tRNA ligase [Candidatus Bathyarchaeia archaeon]